MEPYVNEIKAEEKRKRMSAAANKSTNALVNLDSTEASKGKKPVPSSHKRILPVQ